MIRVFVSDDHELIRAGLRAILEPVVGLAVIGEATNGRELLAKLVDTSADVLVLDFSMPGISGFELIKRVRREHPRLPILILTMQDEQHFAMRAIRAGASGYLTKDDAGDHLVSAIRKVAAGRPYISETVAEQLAMVANPGYEGALHETLSSREMQVLEEISAGKSVTQIAASLNVSSSTISAHKTHILSKLGLKSSAALMRYAIEHRLFATHISHDSDRCAG